MIRGLQRVCLLLGSNILPEENLPRAAYELSRLVHVTQASNVWQTAAVGSLGPDFLNAAVLISTRLDPQTLKLQVLRPLERSLGRVRDADKFAARKIDLDIVAWDGQVCDPDLWTFAHLAVPVAELLPDLRSPETGESLAAAALRLMDSTPVLKRSDIQLEMASGVQGEIIPSRKSLVNF
jgi:2-amino-4-hydroxy-6-hydroxymethyldihydropteridine diphosphokinase